MGVTWINDSDQTVSPEVRCWNTTLITVGQEIEVHGCTDNSCDDCDHQNWAGRGLAYGDGAFVATWGWGKPGKVQRSTDGVNWQTVIEGTTHADIAFSGGVFMTGKGRPYFSQDNGLTWGRVTVPSTYNEYYNVRAVGAGSSSLGSRFYIFGDGDRVHSIGTAGETILSPAHPQGCGSYVVGSASNGEVMLSVHGDYNERQAYVCRSADGGETWTRQDIQNVQTPSTILWTGTEFVFWGNASRIYRSTDGLSWSSEAIVANNFWRFPSFGATSRSDSGTFVMINGDWRQWYEQQRFFRSEGRARWTQLPSPVFVRSAHINFLEFGYVDSSLAVSSQLQLAASHDKVSTVKGDLPCF